MGKRKGRRVNGILLLDKPLGMSSNAALQKVRYLFNAQKAGHTGSLDPLATGVLPICFGEASKVTSYLLDSDKRYLCTLQLGAVTSTGDKEGEILKEHDIPAISSTQLETILEQFRGDIEQIPPMYSALKHNGQPLYKLARKGIEVDRKVRKVRIYKLQVMDKTDTTITCDITCSKGTYIRTLAQDIGEMLGCGAHLSMLRRIEVSPFDCSQLYTIETIENLMAENNEADSLLLPIDTALTHYPAITLSQEEAQRIQNGLKVKRAGIPQANIIKLYLENGDFIGIGRQAGENLLAPKRLMRTN